MQFNRRPELEGSHAFLSPSNYHWVNYTDQKLEARFVSAMAARRGTELHDFAHEAIRLGIKLPRSQKTINLYVNDGIGWKMDCEVPLYYSPNCFGHADTISFRKNVLRISDLKTGLTQASHKQLEVYAAIFCLEYSIDPFEIESELRIYQNDEIRLHVPDPEVIVFIMDRIVDFDQKIQAYREGGQW